MYVQYIATLEDLDTELMNVMIALGTPAIEEDKDILWGEYDYSANTPVVEYIAWRRKVNFH